MNFFYDLTQYSFLLNAVLAIVFSGIASGISGSFVVKKKMTFVAGGLAHAILGGIGIAYFLGMNTSIGAVVFAFIFSGIITLAKHKGRQDENTLIGVLWAMGMSVGIIFMHLTPGYNVDLVSFIFGNILMVGKQDLFNMIILDLFIIMLVFVFYRHFIFVSFDEFFLKIKGIKIELFYFLLLAMISISIVLIIKVVGLILVISMLTIPVITANRFATSFPKLIFGSILLNIIFGFIGIFIAYYLNLPASAVIVIFSGLIYLLSFALKKV